MLLLRFVFLLLFSAVSSMPEVQPGSSADSAFTEVGVSKTDKLSAEQQQRLEQRVNQDLSLLNIDQSSYGLSLFASSGCTGATLPVPRDATEPRCRNCFDVCGKTFQGTGSPAATGTLRNTPVSNIRSLRLDHGCVRVTSRHCHGQWAVGDKSKDVAKVFTDIDGCISFPEGNGPVHLELASCTEASRSTELYFYFRDEGRDGAVTASEASDLTNSGLFSLMDVNRDGRVQKSEYKAYFADLDFKNRAEMPLESFASYMDMATSSLQTGQNLQTTEEVADKIIRSQQPSDAQVEAEALRLFGESFQQAKMDKDRAPKAAATTEEHTVLSGEVTRVFGDDQHNPTVCMDGRSMGVMGDCFHECNPQHPRGVLDRCWAECPSGTTDIGLYCAKSALQWDQKASYSRGSPGVTEKCKLSHSHGPGSDRSEPLMRFTVGVASDTQLPWASGKNKSNIPLAVEENMALLQAIQKAPGALSWAVGQQEDVEPLLGVILNGDLTAYGHRWQWNLFRKLWETHPDFLEDDNLKLPIWPNLGNHDVTGNCFGGVGRGEIGCAERSMAWERAMITGCGSGTMFSRAFGGRVDHYDFDSIAYTVKYGRLRAVFLHNHPAYKRDDVKLKRTMEFLKEEVSYADTVDAYLLLVMHDFGSSQWQDSLSLSEYKEFQTLVNGTRVIGIMHGHIHSHVGLSPGTLQNWDDFPWTGQHPSRQVVTNMWGDQIPIYRSGAAETQTFFLLQYDEYRCTWRMGAVSSRSGVPRWVNASMSRYNRENKLKDCTPSNPSDHRNRGSGREGFLVGTSKGALQFTFSALPWVLLFLSMHILDSIQGCRWRRLH